MGALFMFLIILVFSVVITRFAAAVLIHTGLSQESARFQARSAFTGVGYTTAEAEHIVNHPVRRRIIMLLMLLGNAGIVSAISSLILTFINARQTSYEWLMRILVLAGGVGVIWLLSKSEHINRALSYVISIAIKRWTDIDVRDYAGLLHLRGDYKVVELAIKEGDWIAGRSLAELDLRKEGVVVLGVERKRGRFIGAPYGQTRIKPGDTMIIYGRDAVVKDLDRRCCGRSGDAAHLDAVAQYQKSLEEEERLEKENREQ
jgi:hypothetical protein